MNRRILVYPIVFLSGACALVYQVVWMRIFSYVFGQSVHATAAVLCGFMAGLGLGSHFAPRIVARWKRSPWSLYALLECGIALGAILVPLATQPIQAIFLAVDDLGHAPFLSLSVRFLLSMAVMIVPTFFMGLTLPAILEGLACMKGRRGSRSIGDIYGVNTAGAAAGCLLVGFVLLYKLGISGTTYSVAGLNLVLALVVQVVFGKFKGPAEAVSAPRHTAGARAGDEEEAISPRALLWIYGIIGITSFGYEMCWFRLMTFYLQSATYSFSVMLMVFLVGVGLGSLFWSRLLAGRLSSASSFTAARDLGLVQGLIAICGISALPIGRWFIPSFWKWLLEIFGATNWGTLVVEQVLIASTVILLPTFLMGVAFPLIAHLYDRGHRSEAETVGALYAANTVGAVIGSLATGFVLFGAFGLQKTLLIFGTINLLIGLYVARRAMPRLKSARYGMAVLATIFVVGALASPSNLFRKSFEDHVGKVVYYAESASDITIVYDDDQLRGRYLAFHDGRGTSGTSPAANYFNRLSAYGCMASNPEAKKILVICMGAGNTASTFTVFDIDSLDIVDISNGPFEAAQYFSTNLGVLDDPRVKTWVEDGRNFLLRTKEKYDVIQLEMPSIHTAGVVSLYTTEFYELARSRLNPGGAISQWIDSAQAGREVAYMLLNTMRGVFPNTTAWAHGFSWWGVATNSEEPYVLDHDRITATFDRPSVIADMESVKSSLFDALAKVASAGAIFARTVGDSPIVTDDKTIVDFLVPKLKTPWAFGGGLAYYNSPFRKLFAANWQSSGTINYAGLGIVPFYAENRAELSQQSLDLVLRGFPPKAAENIKSRAGR